MIDANNIINYPVATEKAVRAMESDNKLTFMVNRKSKKSEIKKAAESLFNIKVIKVTTLISTKGTKRAYLKLATDTPALDIATQLGLM
jgi:large subunit ribosomal protein L23